ncbi:hypothetical protein BVRB_4g073340 [Beta vulgaris subsp. vulgaris]|uniref:uncharacterized protein LOC104890051 n=1 Tax=Beta vulgaris subsp. vulgaris TaxID=3555 RepID=UPI00053F577F|nr:uncharacterized protein LOC104890051 [Beta vulgaris subsp. vulgaris]KMT14564.1 hypothetical protein BVRB_4g073340 [Beta vulgaris subsp. vulgaris]
MAAENEAKTATNKRKRGYLPHNKSVRKKGPCPLKPGIQGFFITCDGGREHQATHEAIDVIDNFFEELIHGKDSRVNTKTTASSIPEKALNKKIKFSYSDSSDNDEDDENDAENGKENQSEKVAEDVDNGSTVEEKSVPAKTDEQLNEVESDKAAGDDEENSEQVVGKSKENEEPLEKKQCCDTQKLESKNPSPEMSVDKLIEAELKELGDKSKRRFSKIDTGCNGVVIIQMRRRDGDPNPGDIVQHMMESASATKKHMSRFLLRVLPVEISCYASEEDIKRAIKPLVEQYFPVDAEAPIKFAVQYDARANTGIERMKIIDAVAKSIPGTHKVDLKNPEKTIIVQVVKTVCLIGVVEKYKELAKYNLRQLTSSETQ